jgi:cell wall-associated NlpC family hydrolase
VVASLVLGLAWALPNSAGADALGDARAQAAAVSAKLNGLQAQGERLDEQYNAAQINLTSARSDIAAAQKRLDETNAAMQAKAGQLRQYAVQAYMDGNDTPALEAVLTSQGDDATAKQGYLQSAAGDRQDLIDQLAAARHATDVQLASLHAAEAKASSLTDQLASARRAQQATASQLQAIQSNLSGQIATLVSQQQKAAAAAAAAKAAKAAPAGPVAPAPHGSIKAPPVAGGGDAGNNVPPPGSGAGAAVAAAQSQLGVPYVWAGATPGQGFDCSGLTMWAWGRAGVGLPHSAQGQYNMSSHISESQLQPGDLVFFGSSAGSISHVGMYVGGGTMIHAPHTGSVVSYANIHYWPGEPIFFGRV